MCPLQSLIKSFEVTELPGELAFNFLQLTALQSCQESASNCHVCAVRAAKFVARKQWIVCGSDDMYIRVYNYNTMDKVKAFEAHTDYIRCAHVAAVHGRFLRLRATHKRDLDRLTGHCAAGVLLCTPACPTSCPPRMTCSSSCGTGTRAGPATRSLRATPTTSCRRALGFHAAVPFI